MQVGDEDLGSASIAEPTPSRNSRAENILEKMSLETRLVSSEVHKTAMAFVAWKRTHTTQSLTIAALRTECGVSVYWRTVLLPLCFS